VAWIPPTPINVQTIVLGNAPATTPPDTTQLIIIGVITIVVLSVIWKDLMLAFFDESHARAISLRTGWLHYGLLTAIALMIVASLQAVGIILSIALLVAPGAIALLVARTFAGMLSVAVGSVLLSGPFGIFARWRRGKCPTFRSGKIC